MARKYAQGTSVSPERSRAQIERNLKRYGADHFAYRSETHPDGSETVHIGFRYHGFRYQSWSVRFVLPLPSPDEDEIRLTPGGSERAAKPREAAHTAEIRRRWRSLCMAIQAKLKVVETGISTFEQEFLAHTIIPQGPAKGQTVAQWAIPQLDSLCKRGSLPPLLPHHD